MKERHRPATPKPESALITDEEIRRYALSLSSLIGGTGGKLQFVLPVETETCGFYRIVITR
ncbi:hypothetical protein OKA05_24900 [Luteolibacter arcticus]|uniref:Uncharacterized protein n=1 Tax=Luteolibacter arcticus TaxID=1581411 RepID=A0ABT3GQL7_9BACT|nr:hypothetical protein [Luteolibacter arcticus]MCW1925821.1 hypothetical protein [Luteolibacter arcticus]